MDDVRKYEGELQVDTNKKVLAGVDLEQEKE